MAYSDRELLARLIQCEAGGEGDTGMKAVAGVVMNRVHALGGEYARVGRGSIRNIIFQPYQFVCASETERAPTTPRIFSICGRSRSTSTLPTGPSRGTAFPMWRSPCGFTIPSVLSAGAAFPPRWATGRPALEIIAFIIQRMPIIELERCFYAAFTKYLPRRRRSRPAGATGRRRSMAADKRRQGASVMRAPGSHPEGSEYVTLPGGTGGTPHGQYAGDPNKSARGRDRRAPSSVEEAHNGSIKAMLARNEGNYVVATFLVGTQGTVSWEGSSTMWATTSSPFTSRGGSGIS